jgi:hypothetical protein
MLALIRVNKVKGYREGVYDNDRGEYDSDPREPEQTMAVTLNPLMIKSYYARKNNRVGTRINFEIGNGFAIKETVDEFETLLAMVNDIQIIGTHASVSGNDTQN